MRASLDTINVRDGGAQQRHGRMVDRVSMSVDWSPFMKSELGQSLICVNGFAKRESR